ncbi:MAG: hypothetical protein U0169_08245 [Polyangiaceae bacterium]
MPEALRPIVDEATTFERDAVAALRYFCDHDTSVQASLDALDVDATVVSLVESLRALATLLDTHGASLKHADLPERPGRHARELATALVELASPDDPKAVELRNRAFWHLRHALESVRSAARYLLRAEPASLTFFRAAPVRVAAI